jgi:hypothetical protein
MVYTISLHVFLEGGGVLMKKITITILFVICALCLTSNSLMAALPDYEYFDSHRDSLDYDMIDISTTGTRINAYGDDWYSHVHPPFLFPFFGQNFGTVYISSNGFISFSATGASTYSNTPIPNSDSPNYMIAALWDDLYIHNDVYGGSGIYYQYISNLNHPNFTGPAYVILWNDVSHLYNTSYRFDFEIILFPNGDILMQYGQDYLDFPEWSFTTGIEDGTGTVGLQYAYDDLSNFEETFAILFTEGNLFDDVEENPDWDELYGEVLYEDYDKLPTSETRTEGEDTFLGIPCFITAAAGQSNALFPLLLAAFTLGGAIIRKRISK